MGGDNNSSNNARQDQNDSTLPPQAGSLSPGASSFAPLYSYCPVNPTQVFRFETPDNASWIVWLCSERSCHPTGSLKSEQIRRLSRLGHPARLIPKALS